MKFDFTDKSSYLAWRQQWKDEYMALAAEIRRLKRGRKMYLRTYERTTGERVMIRRLVAKVANPEYAPLDSRLGRLRREAAFEMERLAEAKKLSWQLKQARVKAA